MVYYTLINLQIFKDNKTNIKLKRLRNLCNCATFVDSCTIVSQSRVEVY